MSALEVGYPPGRRPDGRRFLKMTPVKVSQLGCPHLAFSTCRMVSAIRTVLYSTICLPTAADVCRMGIHCCRLDSHAGWSGRTRRRDTPCCLDRVYVSDRRALKVLHIRAPWTRRNPANR